MARRTFPHLLGKAPPDPSLITLAQVVATRLQFSEPSPQLQREGIALGGTIGLDISCSVARWPIIKKANWWRPNSRKTLRQQTWQALVADDNPLVRLMAAYYPGCPLQHLITLAADPIPEVRRAVVTNPSCPIEALVTLWNDSDTICRYVARKHASIPEHMRAVLTLAGDCS